MEDEERKWAERCALNIVVSDADRATLRRIAPHAKLIVVPNGVDTRSFEPSEPSVGEEAGIVFVGGYGWLPNRDALAYFCEGILPRVRARYPSIRVEWVGRAPKDIQWHYRNLYDVALTGYVPDIRPYVRRAACYVVPIRVGGGTRLKILDAWAMGKAVVSTTAGCEGLDAKDGGNILVRDEPGEFAEAIDLVLRDESVRRELGARARRTAVEQYDWEVIGVRMLSAYRGVIAP